MLVKQNKIIRILNIIFYQYIFFAVYIMTITLFEESKNLYFDGRN